MAAGPDRFQSQHVTEECEKGVASPIISSYISGMVNSRDLKEIVDSQVSTLERFEKTNETLSRINALSEVRYDALQTDFRKHISLLVDMKANLDSIFKRIRVLKRSIQSKYPEAYEACEVVYVPPNDEENAEDDHPKSKGEDNS